MSAVYIHIPFCIKRCYYCDFITYAGQGDLIGKYVETLLDEIEAYRGRITDPIDTVYFGGGTPSVLPAKTIASIITALKGHFILNEDAEITLEGNPGTLSLPFLQALRQAGVNRLSLGIQSFDNEDLKVLGRIHNAEQAQEAIDFSRQAGFENLSLDLIFGLPGQSLERWQENLKRACDLGVEHLSLYSLILEENTEFARMLAAGELVLPDDDLVADMFEWAIDHLPTRGYQHYEISNWARNVDLESRHNKVYWHNLDYLGLGAGAHGRLGERRYHNYDNLQDYIGCVDREDQAGSPYVMEQIPISRRDAMQEQMMLGLRLTQEGVSDAVFRNRFGFAIQEAFPTEINKLLGAEFVEWAQFEDGPHLRLTRRGIMLGNQVFQEFVD